MPTSSVGFVHASCPRSTCGHLVIVMDRDIGWCPACLTTWTVSDAHDAADYNSVSQVTDTSDYHPSLSSGDVIDECDEGSHDFRRAPNGDKICATCVGIDGVNDIRRYEKTWRVAINKCPTWS